jgi:hypothetical protein
VTVTKNRSSLAADATTYRSDFNVDGTINSGDATIAKNRSSNTLFP